MGIDDCNLATLTAVENRHSHRQYSHPGQGINATIHFVPTMLYESLVSKKPDDDLDLDLVTEDEAIDLVIDAVLVGSKPLRKLTKKIRQLHRRLHRKVDADAWKVFLALEEVVNERASYQMNILVRWAFGRRARRWR